MLIQWCLKGIVEQRDFGDQEAIAAMSDEGIRSAWLRNKSKSAKEMPMDSQKVLSSAALDAHVNGYGASADGTPYISLSAGCVERDPLGGLRTFPALSTALSFATNGGIQAGYVFRLWVLVSPKPCPELPGFAEEVRDLNMFRRFWQFHDEGEVAAKLYVPSRQIAAVFKFDASLNLVWAKANGGFVSPDRISNVLEIV